MERTHKASNDWPTMKLRKKRPAVACIALAGSRVMKHLGGPMYQRTSNRSFALVRDEATGLEFWEVWDERMPFGSCGYRIMAVFHDFWFTAGDDGDWNGPFRSREQIYGRQGNRPRPCGRIAQSIG